MSRKTSFNPVVLPLAIALSLPALAIGAPENAAPPAAVKYYANGQRVAAPNRKPPVYPVHEQRRRIGGSTIVAYSFDADGMVTSAEVKVSSGNANLDRAAVAAVKGWRVEPVLRDGVPVAGSDTTPINFTP